MTSVVRLLIIVNAIVFAIQRSVVGELQQHFALWPLGRHFVPGVGVVGFEPWQIFTSAFMHVNFAHIALNMFALWQFGSMVERAVGSRRFAWLYFTSVLTASLVQLLVVTATIDRGVAGSVGASGGVFGVLLAFAFLYPQARLIVFPVPIPLRAWVLVAGYAAIELASGVLGTTQGVAHFAHLGGMLGAAVVLFWWKKSSATQA